MEAGRELDALVAEKVMGWERRSESWYDEEGVEGTRFISPDEEVEATAFGWYDDCDYDALDKIPHYSTDIAAAWEVVEHLNNTGIGRLQLTRMGWKGSPAQSWRATFFRDAVSVNSESRADTAPMAICMAALKAAGVEVGDG